MIDCMLLWRLRSQFRLRQACMWKDEFVREYFVLDILLGGRVHVLHFACFYIFIFGGVCRNSGAALTLIVFSSSTLHTYLHLPLLMGQQVLHHHFLWRKGTYCLSSAWTNGGHHVFAQWWSWWGPSDQVQGVPVNWQNECICPLFKKKHASQVAFGKCLKLSKNLLKLKCLKL
jgi:hypothetical protein